MGHAEHVFLIRKGIISKEGGIWADFGSGEGAFTLALRDLLGQRAVLYSIDKSGEKLKKQEEHFKKMFSTTHIRFLNQDFTKHLELPLLDGILMANALHYVKEQKDFLIHVQTFLKPNGKLLVVEYDTDEGNYWVPYPLSYTTFSFLIQQAGFSAHRLLSTIPSEFLRQIYAAEAIKKVNLYHSQ